MGMCLSCIPAQIFSCCTTAACSALCSCCSGKKISLSSSIATRITYAAIFLLNSGLAFLATSDAASKWIEEKSFGYLKLNCGGGPCYGLMAVHRICFALSIFHLILSASVLGVEDTSHPRATIQNKYWTFKFISWILLLVGSFFIPNGFIQFWSSYVALIGAAIFIIIQLLLLVDFAHTFAETCLEKWENDENDKWKYILVGSTVGLFILAIVLTGLLYGFFAGSGCGNNQFFISFNLALGFIVSIIAVHPKVQDSNPRSGLTQASLVVAYGTYLVTSSIVNEPTDPSTVHCNPLDHYGSTRTTSILLGGIFTIIAIAYSTSRAATQSSTLISSGSNSPDHALPLELPSSLRSQAIRDGIASGSLHPSEVRSSLEVEEGVDDVPDDEKEGVAYSYSLFHLVFAMASMYAAMLITNWNAVIEHPNDFIIIGRSTAAMWVKVASSWLCYALYAWTLVAPLVFPDREWL